MTERSIRTRYYPLEGFSPEFGSFSEVPPGVNVNTLWNLWDIVRKWGSPNYHGMEFTLSPLKLDAYDHSKSYFGGLDGLTVFRYELGREILITDGELSVIRLKNELLIIWDLKASAEDASYFIETIDYLGKKAGLLYKGKRLLRI